MILLAYYLSDRYGVSQYNTRPIRSETHEKFSIIKSREMKSQYNSITQLILTKDKPAQLGGETGLMIVNIVLDVSNQLIIYLITTVSRL